MEGFAFLQDLKKKKTEEMKTVDCAFSLTQYNFTGISLCPALSLSLLGRALKKRTWSLPVWSNGQGILA